MQASPRILKEAKRNAEQQAIRIRADMQRMRVKSWDDIERVHHITIPADWKAKPFTYATVSGFATVWQHSFEIRLKTATESKPSAAKMIRIDKDVDTFGNITLFPEQQGCYKEIFSAFYTKGVKAAYQDGHTGSGKTIVAIAWIAEFYRKGMDKLPEHKWKLHKFIILTPKGVVEHWKRELEKAGLGDKVSRREIYVMSEAELTTDLGDSFAHIEEDLNTGAETMTWNAILTPAGFVVDEAHHYINPKSGRTQKLIASFSSPFAFSCRWLFMSATPMEKVNDAYTFCLACDTSFMDMHVNEQTFKTFAGLMAVDPSKPDRESVKRLRGVLSPFIFSLPYVKPKHKAINVVQLVDFFNESHRKIYATAHQRYIDACRKSGKNTAWGRFERFIALNNFAKTAEPLRAWWLAWRAYENFKSGNFATAIGCRFKETITETAFQLVDKYNIPMENISIIWGGKREYKTEELLTKEQLEDVIKRASSGEFNEILKNKGLLKRVRLTLRYLQDQHEHDETPEEQAYRHKRLSELRLLGKQNDNQRQYEIDKFQDGTSRICLFTIASGGVGLSLDRNKESLLPREGLFTPVYSGKDFQQALGRLVRRVSISDAVQRICMLKGTVEEHHVAPILDEKLKCIAEITNRNFDIIDLLQNDAPLAQPVHVRDIIEAESDAAKDNTVVSDFRSEEDEDDDDTPDNPDDLFNV